MSVYVVAARHKGFGSYTSASNAHPASAYSDTSSNTPQLKAESWDVIIFVYCMEIADTRVNDDNPAPLSRPL